MKKGVIIFAILLFAFAIFPIVFADEESQINQAYECLENKISTTGCSSMSFEEKVFSLLAVRGCKQEVLAESFSNQCWPGSDCDLKSTSLSLLALADDINTTEGENWLLSKTANPTGIDWFLEIESLEPTTCQITSLGASYSFSIGEDKKISNDAGVCLSLSTGAYENYFFLVSPDCYNEEFTISCDKSFITTLLFKKQGSDSNPLHVLEEVHSASADGQTTETIDAKCFSESGVCNYEGSLWATLALYYLDQDVSSYMPYLLTLKDDNEQYLPESFLYFITGKLRDELLLKQISNQYWQASSTNSKYYDTALALLPFLYKSSYVFEKENSMNWLLDTQDTSGCWDNGNIRNTAFILYSIWPQYFVPPECEDDDDCSSVEQCVNEECVPKPDCETDDDCADDERCLDEVCVPKPECDENNPCPNEDEVCNENGICVPKPDCETDDDCLDNEICINEYCVPKPECDENNPCPEGEECINEYCVPLPECDENNPCPEITCKIASCNSGICFYDFMYCKDDDGCCSPGCSFLTDNDCPQPPECTEDANCSSHNSNSSKYCYDGNVYMNVSIWGCENESCVENETMLLVEECSALEECSYGNCYFDGGDGCSTDDDCAYNEVCNEDGVCVDNESIGLDCEASNFWCMSKSDCDGNILSSYDCSGLYKCCDTEKTYETCSLQGGDICAVDEACIGGTSADASDLGYGEICCISGTCGTSSGGDKCTYDSECDSDEECLGGECVTKEGDCEDHDGTCRSTCLDTEEETFFYTCDGSKSCCISSKSTKKSYVWVWILLILILLSALGIVFRDKLRTQWMKIKSKFGKKKSKKKRKPGMLPLPIHTPKPIRRTLPRKIIPTPQRPPMQKKPLPKKKEEKPSSELDDVLKKLRDLGK